MLWWIYRQIRLTGDCGFHNTPAIRKSEKNVTTFWMKWRKKFLFGSCFISWKSLNQQFYSFIHTKTQRGRKKRTGWLNRGITSAFRTLSIWSLQPTFTWPSFWEQKGQQRRTNINLLCSFIPLISSSHPLKMASCGSLLKSAVVGLALLMIVVESGPVGEINLSHTSHTKSLKWYIWHRIILLCICYMSTLGEKLASCCKKVNSQRITDPITGYMVQKASLSCVPAVM